MANTPAFAAYARHHQHLIESYRRRDWPAARAALASCRALDNHNEILCDLYQQRIAAFETVPPAEDWDGVFTALTK
jgi:adenylate cyclase